MLFVRVVTRSGLAGTYCLFGGGRSMYLRNVGINLQVRTLERGWRNRQIPQKHTFNSKLTGGNAAGASTCCQKLRTPDLQGSGARGCRRLRRSRKSGYSHG